MGWNEDADEDYEIEGAVCVGHTDKALLIRAPEFSGDTWIPKSVVTEDSEVYGPSFDAAGPGTLIVKGWYAEKEDWV